MKNKRRGCYFESSLYSQSVSRVRFNLKKSDRFAAACLQYIGALLPSKTLNLSEKVESQGSRADDSFCI